MKYFSEEKNDIEGYHKNLLSLKKILEPETFKFMINESFHDSTMNKIITINNYDENKHTPVKDSIVSVSAHLKHWNEHKYELIWGNVTVYLLDFDILLIENGKLRHEIFLFSKTTIIIECSKFSIHQID